MAKKTVLAHFVSEIVVTDPDSKLPVHVSIYKEEGGGMFGVDSSYVEGDVDEIVSPFGNGIVLLEDDDEPESHGIDMDDDFENEQA